MGYSVKDKDTDNPRSSSRRRSSSPPLFASTSSSSSPPERKPSPSDYRYRSHSPIGTSSRRTPSGSGHTSGRDYRSHHSSSLIRRRSRSPTPSLRAPSGSSRDRSNYPIDTSSRRTPSGSGHTSGRVYRFHHSSSSLIRRRSRSPTHSLRATSGYGSGSGFSGIRRRSRSPTPSLRATSGSGTGSGFSGIRRRSRSPTPSLRATSGFGSGFSGTRRRSRSWSPEHSIKGKGNFFQAFSTYTSPSSSKVNWKNPSFSSTPPSGWKNPSFSSTPPSGSESGSRSSGRTSSFSVYPAPAPDFSFSSARQGSSSTPAPPQKPTHIEIVLSFVDTFKKMNKKKLNVLVPKRRIFSTHAGLVKDQFGCSIECKEEDKSGLEANKATYNRVETDSESDFKEYWSPLNPNFDTVEDFLTYQWGKHGLHSQIDCSVYFNGVMKIVRKLIPKLERAFAEVAKPGEQLSVRMIDIIVRGVHAAGTRVHPILDKDCGVHRLSELHFLFDLDWNPVSYAGPIQKGGTLVTF